MKIKRIYATENGMCMKDWSKDRVILDMSENEWVKLKLFIDIARFEMRREYWERKAKNLYQMFNNSEEMLSEFKDLPF